MYEIITSVIQNFQQFEGNETKKRSNFKIVRCKIENP